MAVTKIWAVRGRLTQPIDYAMNPKKTEKTLWKEEDSDLAEVLSYAVNSEKTEKQYYVSGINCEPESARQEFNMVKRQFQKEGGIICYHGYQSFREGEVTPSEAHAIGVELAKRLWGNDYQIIVTTHLNTKCLHNHFVVNSVSFMHGRRCRSTKWRELKEISDEICGEYKKSVILPFGKGVPYTLAKAEKSGKPSRLNLAKAVLDDGLSECCNLKELELYLKNQGYEFMYSPNRKYWTVKQKDWKRPLRIAHMGENYTNERITSRLIENQRINRLGMRKFQKKKQILRKAKTKYCRKKPKRKVGGLRGRYLRYCYRLGVFSKKQNKRVYYLYRDDLLKLKHITDETSFLCEKKIESAEELFSYKEKTERQVLILCEERSKIYNLLRRQGLSPGEKERYIAQRADITAQIRKYKKEMHLCENILIRSKCMKEKMENERSEKAMNEKTKENERSDER